MKSRLEATAQNAQPPVLAAYADYRHYLSDFYKYKVKTSSSVIRPYSYATFSAAADIKSPNYLKLIIEGKRNLSDAMVLKFAKALQLDKKQTEEFAVLVKYGQAKDPLERNQFLKQLSDLRVKRQIDSGELNSENFEKVPSWVTWVLYAMADQKGVNFDIDQLKNLMKGRARIDEIQRCLDGLVETGELEKTEDGEFKKGRRMMKGAEQVPSALVKKLQRELIYLGMESLYQDEPNDREFGALTLCLTESEFEKLKFELRHFRKKIYKDFMMNRETSKGDRVFQMNMQFFPVTDPVLDN